VLRAASRAVDELGPTGLLLGIDATESYGTEIVEGLEAGDSLLLFTDGIWEARDASGRPLGLDAFAAWVREHGAGGAAPLAEGVRGALDAFAAGAPRRDDMTFLAASLRAPAHA
jgi:sigma-B regulation protein RsbU (phosphoserine phosphatase)